MSGEPGSIRAVHSIGGSDPEGHCWTGPFIIVAVFLLFEFGAPQVTFPFLRPVRPLLVLTMLLALILAVEFLSGRLQIKEPRVKLVLLFWILMALHIPLAFNNQMAYGLTQAMFPYVVLFVGIVTFTKTMRQLVSIVHLWLLLHVYQALHGITHGGNGIGGYFADENELAVSLAMAMPVAYFLFLKSRHFKRAMYGAGLALAALGVVSTFSRGGFLGLIAVAGYCFWKSPFRLRGLLTILIVLIVLLLAAPSGYWAEVETIAQGTQDRTVENRIYLWGVAWRMFLDNLLWGVGPGSYPYAVPVYEPPEKFYGKGQGMRAVHSTHFTLLSELGIPGVIIFTLLVYRLWQSCRNISAASSPSVSMSKSGSMRVREAQPPKTFLWSVSLGLAGGIGCFLAAGAFVSMLYYPQFWALTGIVVAAHQVSNKASIFSPKIP